MGRARCRGVAGERMELGRPVSNSADFFDLNEFSN
jgi:hypothetical protein